MWGCLLTLGIALSVWEFEIQMLGNVTSALITQNPLLYVSGGKVLETYLLIIKYKLCDQKLKIISEKMQHFNK